MLFITGGALSSLTGCLGAGGTEDTEEHNETEDSADPGGGTTMRSGAINPDAHYVVKGPEGYFSAKGPWNTDLNGVVIHGYDLVAYFEESRPLVGSEAYEYEYDGVMFRFASDSNQERFAADPTAYLPEFGGYCSLGVGNGYKDGMHPEVFDILDGKLYFNLTPQIHEGWLQSYEERIETANANWPDIKGSDEPIHIGPGLP